MLDKCEEANNKDSLVGLDVNGYIYKLKKTIFTCMRVSWFMCYYSLADDCIHPGGVALRNLEAGQSTGFDDEVIHTKFDILGFHFLHREGQVVK